MKKYKRILSLLLVALMSVSLLSSCGGEEEPEEKVYALTPITAEELVNGKYYVKNGESFYELPTGFTSFSTEAAIPRDKNVDVKRVIMFGPDDVTIPTLYMDDKLVLVTDSMPDSFTWERYKDNGYTVGVYGLEVNNTGSYAGIMEGSYYYPESSLKTKIADSGAEVGSNLVYDAVDGLKIGPTAISEAGTILGLAYGKSYNIDVYNGSKYLEFTEVVADTHAFSAFEMYSSSICNYTQANYIQIVIPDHFVSGYYFINGVGFVKYVAGPRSAGIADIDFNKPYYLKDAEGNLYTADQAVDPETGVIVKEEDPFYSSVINVDCSNETMEIKFNYSDATTTNIDGSTITLKDEEVGQPVIKLYDPDGNELDNFLPSNNEKNTLSMKVQNPIPGRWEAKIWNADKRMFSVETSFVSGHNDTLNHTGGTGKMTYYMPNHMNNAEFRITWTNTTQLPSNIFIQDSGQNGEKQIRFDRAYVESIGGNYVERRGEIVMSLGELKYGDYTITLEGNNSLGRIRVEVIDLNPYAEAPAEEEPVEGEEGTESEEGAEGEEGNAEEGSSEASSEGSTETSEEGSSSEGSSDANTGNTGDENTNQTDSPSEEEGVVIENP